MKKILKSIRENKKYAILTPVCVLFEVSLEIFIPFMMSLMIDYGIEKNDTHAVLLYGGIMVALSCLSLLFGVLAAKYSSTGAAGFAKNLRYDMYEHIQTYSFSNLDKFTTASLVTRMTTDVNYVELAFQLTTRLVTRAPVMLIASTVMSFIKNHSIAWIFLSIIPFVALVLFVVMASAFKPFSKMFRWIDESNRVCEENLIGIRVVKSFTKEEDEISKFDYVTGELKKYATKGDVLLAWNGPIMSFVIFASMLLLSYLAAKQIIAGSMSTGDLTAMISYLMQSLSQLLIMSNIFVVLAMSNISAKRIKEVLEENTNILNPSNPIYEVADSSFSFENVNFRYLEDANGYNLNDINVSVKPGSVVGITGCTGSGKSTFVSLISRLYDVNTGSVKVGGVDVRNYDLTTLRNNVSVVLQKNVLFSGNIRENLKWGKLDASDDEIWDALKKAGAYDFVKSFPDALDHDLGQGGVNVSGGQKQRLCIARALLKNPKILILDDSTSAVDTKTDALIRSELKKTLPDVTKIIVSQRISSIEDADLILVFDNGYIKESGSHKDLIVNSEIYKEIYEIQKKGDDCCE